MSGLIKAMHRVTRVGAALGSLVLALPGATSAADLLDVRFGPSADATRIVFDLEGAPDYQVTGDGEGAGRIFVNFTDLDGKFAQMAGKGHVASVDFVKSGKSGVQVVVALKKTAKIKEVFVLEPSPGVAKHRLVLDLATSDKAALLVSLPSQYGDLTAVIEQVTAAAEPDQKAATPVQTASVTPPSRQEAKPAPKAKKVVVIDPGHGGRDPGAQGQSGTLEKVVNLAAAKELAEMLEARGGYKVVLTRNEDETIRPDARETLARTAGADLFISLHADAIAQHAVRGASVYTLSEEGTARSMNLAKSQGNYHAYNLDFGEYETDVRNILLEKAQDVTLKESSRFAELLIENLSGKTPMLNRSHRKGDLRVLLAADVPAVLLEMAFISNAKDEANLLSPVWRKRVMGAVAESIDVYFEARTPTRQAGLAPAGGK